MIYIALLGTAAVVTAFLSGIFGMAGGMILMGILLVLMPVSAAMVLHGVAQLTSNGWRAVLWYRYIRRDIFLRYLVGSALAAGVFFLVRFVPDERLVLLALGLSPFIALAIPERQMLQVDHRLGAEVCGSICTVFQFLSGVSAPVLDAFFVRSAMDRRTVVATKAACQVLSHLVKLIYFGSFLVAGSTDVTSIVVGVVIICSIIGTSLSRSVLERLTDMQFRRWTRLIVMAVGAVYLIKAATAWSG